MNVAMWLKALQIIPRINKEEWDGLDVISRWLISTRAAVLIMTFISATIGGLLAARPTRGAGQSHRGFAPGLRAPIPRGSKGTVRRANTVHGRLGRRWRRTRRLDDSF